MASFPSVKQRAAGESGAACLLALARHHGLALEQDELLRLTGLDDGRIDDLGLLFAAGELGFEAVPLEGEFHELPEVPRPCLIGQKPGHERFAVLLEIDADGATLADPATGERLEQGREDFVARWSGDAFQLTPLPDKQAVVRARLDRERRWTHRRLGPLGLWPFGLKAGLFLLGLAVLVGLLVTALVTGRMGWLALREAAAVVLLLGWAGAWAGSWWSALLATSCSSCSHAGQLTGGLPVAWGGVGFYTGMGAALLLIPPGPWRGMVAAAALGAHGVLVALLLRERIRCLPCLGTAASALAAAGGAVALGFVVWQPLVAVASAVGTWLALALARRAAPGRMLARVCGFARRLGEQRAAPSDQPLPVLAFVRERCPACVFYKAVIRPGLERDFGEALHIEQTPAPAGLPTPLLVIPGQPTVVAFAFHPETAYAKLVATLQLRLAVHAGQAPPVEGLWVVSEMV